MADGSSGGPGLSRRRFIAVTAATGGLALAACDRRVDPKAPPDVVDLAEGRRPHSGRTVTRTLTAERSQIDLGGTIAYTIAYDNAVPGRLLRASVGDEMEVLVRNRLNRATSVHWHGIALRNDMDGAAPATPDIEAGRDFTYRFSVPNPGTYWAHPHTGLDADTGLYLPVIVDDPNDPGDYDAEWVVVLDDWTDGVGSSPSQLYDGLRKAPMPDHDMSGIDNMHAMPGMPGVPGVGGVGRSQLLGGDAGDVDYPYYLINGRIPAAATAFSAKPGQRLRIRIVNAGSDTAFRVALSGHRLTVTHSDGFPVMPTEVDALLIGMGERYDVLTTVGDGVFPLVAAGEGKNAVARALLVTGSGTPPPAVFAPAELRKRVGTVDQFVAAPGASLPVSDAHRDLPIDLAGSMMNYDWTINGLPFGQTRPLTIRQGQRITLTLNNTSSMWHPMHLHGHTFQLLTSGGPPGARKDTVIVLPKQKLTVAFDADNPGIWMLHCHNTYHQEAGMMTSVNYVT